MEGEKVMNHKSPFLRERGYLLRGLLSLPFGLWLVLWVAARFLWPDFHRNWGGNSSALLLAPLAIAGILVIKRYYQAKEALPQSAFASSIVPWIVILGFLVLGWSFALAVSVESAIAAQGIWVALVFLTFGHRFSIHIASGVVLLVTSLTLLFFTLSSVMSIAIMWIIVWLLIGCTIIIGSIYEHLVFVRRRAERTASA